jgi:flagellar biosynthesis/type III secretory pathway protein FliH
LSRAWFLLLNLLLLALPLFARELTPYRHGYEQGRQAGCREGRERLGDAGCYQGDQEGFAAGILFGQQRLIDGAWAQGLAAGQAEGSERGRREGFDSGQESGRQEGLAQGESQARLAADGAARDSVGPRALADGQARAALADPVADGLRDGRQAGLQKARREAGEKDYERARSDYRGKRFSAPPRTRTSVRQAPLAASPYAWPGSAANRQTAFGGHAHPAPDWRYLRYGSDNEEYQRGYREGYCQGVRDGYESGYDRQYRLAFDRAYALGAAQATVANLQETFDQAYQTGFAEIHAESFAKAREAAHREAFTSAYESAYASTYAALYPQYEMAHYRSIEESAFQSLYGPPYQEAFARSEATSFSEAYPAEARRAYDLGWRDEATDFVARPVRVLGAWKTPSDVPGLQLLTVRLRNFSAQTVAGSRIRVSLGAQASRLYHPLPADSEVTVTGLLRLREEVPEQAELFAVIESDGQRLPLGTISVASQEP